MKENIQELFRGYKSREAFWAAAENVMTDRWSQTMLLRLAGKKNHIVMLREDMDRIRELADSGNPYMQYTYARLHDVLLPDPDSVETVKKYYTRAMEGGIADAKMQLAFAYRDGDFGEMDRRRYRKLMEEALAEGSDRAAQQKLNEMIFGADGVEAEPEKALRLISEYLSGSEEEPDPIYYKLRGNAEEKLGKKEEAVADYRKAAENGFADAYFWLAILICCDENGTVVDSDRFTEIMSAGQEANSPLAYLETACLITPELYEGADEKSRSELRNLLEEQLSLASLMGECDAPFWLGHYYENGLYGFAQDNGLAWQMYAKAAWMRSAEGYASLSRMVLEDGTAPEDKDEDFGYECAYRGYALGSDTLETVIRGYRNGHLTHHAAVIEEFLLPRYEELCDEEDCDDYYEPEIEEDCYAVSEDRAGEGTDPQRLSEICEECLAKAEEADKDRRPWDVAEYARRYADAADILKGYEHMLNSLYSWNSKLLDLIVDRPRLKLRLCRIHLSVLRWIEALQGHELGMADDLADEIRELSGCISLANEGRLDEIPQTELLKRDPVEWTAAWENVIDEADRMAYGELKDVPMHMGWCFAFWSARAVALGKFGIEWRSPGLMNPGVIFD